MSNLKIILIEITKKNPQLRCFFFKKQVMKYELPFDSEDKTRVVSIVLQITPQS